MMSGGLICGHFARPFVVHSYGYERLSASQTGSQLTSPCIHAQMDCLGSLLCYGHRSRKYDSPMRHLHGRLRQRLALLHRVTALLGAQRQSDLNQIVRSETSLAAHTTKELLVST